ncbi:ATP-binding protein [Caenimonas sedimenti]|uniref:ATP-binding protein n=1 Tax=Caenimonas sedimenti TaxID=2596921 RepID=A0A562ZS91_9BURK|nr:ATP-binding protein [Caenimonas sedimenti]TWO71459.1 ATP-binding protein [Caenimonas sedimenti]
MVNWFREKMVIVTVLIVHAMFYWWVAVVGYKALNKIPLLYHYYPVMSAEATPVIVIIALSLLSMVAGLVVKAVRRGAGDGAFVLEYYGPWFFGFSALVLFLWWQIGPVANASYVPLVGLFVVSGVGTWAVHWGFLKSERSDRERAKQAIPDAGEPPEEPARVSHPTTTFASIYGNEAIKQRLKDASTAIVNRKKDTKPRNGILLHGLPGNGKTVFAEALAGELKLPFLQLSAADVASKWVGERTSLVRGAFAQARRMQPCVLFVDEVDSFLESRDGGANSTKEDRDVVNALLTLMVDIREARVILIAATNHIDRLDGAGVREGRFDYKVEITPPDEPARIGLLRKGLKSNAPSVRVDEAVLVSVAKRWNGFSSKRILAVTEELSDYLRGQGGSSEAGFEDFMGALRQLQGQRGSVPENVRPLEDLVFSPRTRDMLDQVVGRMADPEHTEKHGGTLPTGVLFYGPPGTGKTAACKALARKVGWAFLPATGADLARDPKRLEALYAKAQDLRPTVIFIDEADELLRSREFSPATEATNKLLTLMDGVGDRVADVVWIAATNNPEQIDPALLRGGRFTEKVRFDLPSAEDLARHLVAWFAKRSVQLEPGIGSGEVAAMLVDQSIANAEAVAQHALNRAIARREEKVIVRRDDITSALDSVIGG